MNQVILIGRLTKDPEIKINGNFTVCNFSLAVDKNLSKQKKTEYEQQGKLTVDYIPCSAFGAVADNIGQYKKKGDQIAVLGYLSYNAYMDSQGNKRSSIRVNAISVEFLQSVNRNNQPPQNNQQGQQQPQQNYQNNYNQPPQNNYGHYGVEDEPFHSNDDDIPF